LHPPILFKDSSTVGILHIDIVMMGIGFRAAGVLEQAGTREPW